MFTEIMLWIFIGPGQFFAMLILNVPRNHRMFLKSTPSEKKAELISAHIIFNFPFIVTRLFIWIAVGRKLFEFFSPITIPYIPTLRELSLVPFVVLRDILHITGLANIFSGEGAVAEAPVEAPIE